MLLKCDHGMDLALSRAKAWSKYAKDIITYVEKRAAIGKLWWKYSLCQKKHTYILLLTLLVPTGGWGVNSWPFRLYIYELLHVLTLPLVGGATQKLWINCAFPLTKIVINRWPGPFSTFKLYQVKVAGAEVLLDYVQIVESSVGNRKKWPGVPKPLSTFNLVYQVLLDF